MGTSSPSGGASPATPLVPDWADDPTPPADGPLVPPSEPVAPQPPSADPPPQPSAPLPTQPEPPHGPSERWRDSRAQFTRFARGGGASQRALRNALAGYIRRSVGGAGTAAR